MLVIVPTYKPGFKSRQYLPSWKTGIKMPVSYLGIIFYSGLLSPTSLSLSLSLCFFAWLFLILLFQYLLFSWYHIFLDDSNDWDFVCIMSAFECIWVHFFQNRKNLLDLKILFSFCIQWNYFKFKKKMKTPKSIVKLKSFKRYQKSKCSQRISECSFSNRICLPT